MPKPACVKCQRFFRPKRNGQRVVESMPIGDAPPGTEAPNMWEPYKLWVADLWECPGCGFELICGYGAYHMAERYEPDFAKKLRGVPARHHHQRLLGRRRCPTPFLLTCKEALSPST